MQAMTNRQLSSKALLVALTLGASAGASSLAHAQTPAEFYKGKTVEFLIGYATGGSNDTYARVIAQHMGKHIPGNPTVIVRNMPGAGSFLATNQIFNASPKDGTVIGLGAPTLALDEKLGTQGVRFKTSELNWVGRVTPLINIVFMWKTSPVKSITDAQQRESTLSGTGAGSTASIYPTVLNNMIGTKFKIVMGYKGSNEAMLAMERGEVEGHSTAFEAVRSAKPMWLEDGSINIIAQLGLKRLKELPNVPTAVELGKTEEDKKVLYAITSASEIGTSFFTTPKTPADRLTALRRAFDATMTDKEFLADIAKLKIGLDPMKGEDVQKLVAEVSDVTPELLAKIKAAYPAPGQN